MPFTVRPRQLALTALTTVAVLATGTAQAQAQAPELPDPTGSDLVGGLRLNGALKGTTQIGSPITDGTFAADGTTSGRISFGRATASPAVDGWLFANLTMEFEPNALLTGTWTGGPYAATAKITVRFPKVDFLGFRIASGPNCKTREPATLTLRGSKPTFDPNVGERLTGTLAIGPLANCGAFTGYASSLLASPKHEVALELRRTYR